MNVFLVLSRTDLRQLMRFEDYVEAVLDGRHSPLSCRVGALNPLAILLGIGLALAGSCAQAQTVTFGTRKPDHCATLHSRLGCGAAFDNLVSDVLRHRPCGPTRPET